ncbi:GntR family transcriptional regulator [Nonomuraea sp. B10E15]|uniref:GntR family transcriptional regulator n=1 Tax=Nonomuraea sp. B10E15 TaxID=3153560 RepID=UPI00325FD02A
MTWLPASDAANSAPTGRIPSEQVLMRQYGVAKVTARLAVSRLREQRWVVTVPHRGTYVCDPTRWPVSP